VPMYSLRALVCVWFAAACLSVITTKETMAIIEAPACLTVAQVCVYVYVVCVCVCECVYVCMCVRECVYVCMCVRE